MGIANVYYSQGRYEEALVQYQKVLEVFLAVYVQEHPLVAETKENIGLVYETIGKNNEAINDVHRGSRDSPCRSRGDIRSCIVRFHPPTIPMYPSSHVYNLSVSHTHGSGHDPMCPSSQACVARGAGA